MTGPIPKGAKTKRIKPRRVEDPEHLARVRALPCLVCGRMPVEAHHIRQGCGMGQKASDREAIPLCSFCHRTGPWAFHASPSSFQRDHGTERELLARTLEMLG